MRKLFVILLFAFCAANTLFGSSRAYRVEDIPNVQAADRTRFVSNPDGLLSQSAVYRIDTMLYSLKESGRAQVVVVAVNSIGDEVPFDFLQQLVTRWGVGRKEADDGLGILLVVDQGAIEIQTGYGLEGDLPDALLKRIINNYMLPAFRERDWDRGMTEGVAAIAGVLNGRRLRNSPRTTAGRLACSSFSSACRFLLSLSPSCSPDVVRAVTSGR